MMTGSIRPSTPQDGPAIVQLMRESGLNPSTDRQALYWKYWQDRADFKLPRSYVLTRDGEIAAHVGVVPGACFYEGRRATVLHMVDWAASARASGAGLMLMKHLRQRTDLLLAVDGSEATLEVLPIVGFQRTGTATTYVRVLHPLRYLARDAQWNWRTLPKFLRSLWWAFSHPIQRDARWTATPVMPDQLQELAKVLPRAREGAAVMERTLAQFAYVLDCPTAAMTLYAVHQGVQLRGYLILAMVPGQARLVDCGMDSGAQSDWSKLVACAAEIAGRAPGVAELVALASDPTLASCLCAAGFRARSEKPVQMLAKKGADAPTLCPSVHLIESDGAFRHAGRPEFWA